MADDGVGAGPRLCAPVPPGLAAGAGLLRVRGAGVDADAADGKGRGGASGHPRVQPAVGRRRAARRPLRAPPYRPGRQGPGRAVGARLRDAARRRAGDGVRDRGAAAAPGRAGLGLPAGQKSRGSLGCPFAFRSGRTSGAVPGQAAHAPALDGLAVVMIVAVAFETFQHVHGEVVAGFGGHPRRMLGARRAAAQEQHRHVGRHACAQLLDKACILRAAGVGHPFDMGELRVGDVDAAHPVQFGLRAHVHQHGGRVVLQQGIGFLGRQRAEVRQLVLFLTLAGSLEEIVSGGHRRDKLNGWNRGAGAATRYSIAPRLRGGGGAGRQGLASAVTGRKQTDFGAAALIRCFALMFAP
ncbi:hypothetical protein CBM2623_A170278 [Cupriavidus taiwanensis]|nr:hypothetical protein CBM2608_A160229 [Cupriavidus taiwanensis]SPA26147.1 hypothetical protein CBM2623_A170278 [Cupriavidus taiwanensis]SPA44432.1 hypothetical protein CBM2629_A150234 [Cupriavidus taiwanensis]